MFVIFRKKAFLTPIESHFTRFLDPFEKTKLLKFGSHSKELNCPPSYLQVKFKTCLNACNLD